MAWRIDESVIRGEIDNRTRDRVTGRLWVVGRSEPIELELAGNAWRDLAGRRLEFINPNPRATDLKALSSRQTGIVGDCTASRKVKVPEVSNEELIQCYKERRPFLWHWGNCLYLEWFSASNGRVLVESASYQLTVAPDFAWEMSEAEETSQRRANSEAMKDFFSRLNGQSAAGELMSNDPAAADAAAFDGASLDWEDDKPLSEAEAEKMQDDSDRLADRIQARLDREGSAADYDKILEEELERRAQERGEAPPTPEQEAARTAWVEEMNRMAEEALKNPDPELEAEMQIKHPVAERAHALTIRLMREPKKRGWIPADAHDEHPVVDMVTRVMSAGGKLAGALNGQTWPPAIHVCAQHVVRLKRARSYLEDALLAAEFCGEEKLVEADWLAEIHREINGIGEECDMLIGELRARLARDGE